MAKQIEKNKPAGSVDIQTRRETRRLPAKGKIKSYLMTSAQNNTKLNLKVWETLGAIADYYDAELLIGRFMYHKSTWERHSVREERAENLTDEKDALVYDPRVRPYVCDHRVRLAPGLEWCGELDILPTAVRPLSGFDNYAGNGSAIIPHPKVAMGSQPRLDRLSRPRFLYTTGSVTQRNYIQRKAGLKAQFHHVYGALLVQVDSEGRWFARQLIATNDGVICDLDKRFDGRYVNEGVRVEAITWGDIHHHHLRGDMELLCWGPGGILDELRPRYQFMHDLVDFRARNHHDRGDCHRQFEKYAKNESSVAYELRGVARFLNASSRPWCQTIVVDSNHDNAFTRWLREADYRTDPENAEFFLESQLRYYQALRGGDSEYHAMEDALRRMKVSKRIKFLRVDESFLVMGIECGMHGHRGPNGSRGTARNLSRIGVRVNIGHSHAAQIFDGAYVAGVTGDLNQQYNTGPTTWSHSHILTYSNGKRAILTTSGDQWRLT